ncbi:hypothetical protein GCK32_012469 [Trichostrongylus colubriformis]|uniref:Uncharacterized protein n=1 Tax=Trichostrongylus colubriformis TaxID=6319 RepID=A0AAN8IFT3_TRICO
MYRYALAAIIVFVAASVDSRPVQEDIEVELEATAPPIALSTSPTNDSAQSNDTQKGPQKSPGEPEPIGFPGVTNNVAPWSSNGGYGTGAPNGPPTPMEPGPNGWQGPTGVHNGRQDSMGGYGCRSCGGHGHGYSSSGGYNGWPGLNACINPVGAHLPHDLWRAIEPYDICVAQSAESLIKI